MTSTTPHPRGGSTAAERKRRQRAAEAQAGYKALSISLGPQAQRQLEEIKARESIATDAGAIERAIALAFVSLDL